MARSSVGRKEQTGTRSVHPGAEWMSLAELDACVRDFSGTKTLMFDAEFAQALLALNTGNRRVSRRKVDQLASQMQSGAYRNTGEPIIVAREGVLNNGQHRLLAVIASGAIVDMDVRFGIPRAAYTLTDTGKPRSAGDVLMIGGLAEGGRISSALRLLILYERGLPEAVRDFVSNDEIHVALARWPDIVELAERVRQHAFPKPVKSTPLLATAFLASRSPGRAKLDVWLATLATGLDARRDDPAYVLREKLLRGIEAPIGTREGQLERFALMNKSWNLYAAGSTIAARDLRWRAQGRNPEPFPLAEGAQL